MNKKKGENKVGEEEKAEQKGQCIWYYCWYQSMMMMMMKKKKITMWGWGRRCLFLVAEWPLWSNRNMEPVNGKRNRNIFFQTLHCTTSLSLSLSLLFVVLWSPCRSIYLNLWIVIRANNCWYMTEDLWGRKKRISSHTGKSENSDSPGVATVTNC